MFDARDRAWPNQTGALGTSPGPLYAASYPCGTLGTKGRPRINERGQALLADGSVIARLYWPGIATTNPTGIKAVGTGTTIGPCLTWG
jgi:3-oxosteroid 1-dehydrogenase